MERVDRPTIADVERIGRDPAFAREAVERWGADVVMDPFGVYAQPRGVGLGDIVKWITGRFGITPCSACEQRRRKLNRFRVPLRRTTASDDKSPCNCGGS